MSDANWAGKSLETRRCRHVVVQLWDNKRAVVLVLIVERNVSLDLVHTSIVLREVVDIKIDVSKAGVVALDSVSRIVWVRNHSHLSVWTSRHVEEVICSVAPNNLLGQTVMHVALPAPRAVCFSTTFLCYCSRLQDSVLLVGSDGIRDHPFRPHKQSVAPKIVGWTGWSFCCPEPLIFVDVRWSDQSTRRFVNAS